MSGAKLSLTLLGFVLNGILLGAWYPSVLFAATGSAAADPEIVKWGFLTAAASVGISAIAGAVAVAMVGAAAMGAIGERPEVATRALIFVGLAEGIAIYGLIVSVMILGKF